MSLVIIQCGSSARGDANINSDIDLVCIWSGPKPDYKKISAMHGGVTFYSLETIRRMKQKGSLFITHLDIDGICLTGDALLLNEIKGFRPSQHQINLQYQSARKFILNLEWYPDSYIGQLWVCDALYVSLRTCIYCINALNDQYAFGYLDALSKFGLSDNDIYTMLCIREGKYLYRRSKPTILTSKKIPDLDILAINKACKKILKLPIKLVAGGLTNWKLIEGIDYWTERLIERAILNNEHSDEEFMKKMKNHNYNKSSIKKNIINIINMHK
ncbi:nucleotidyltransferase domain-containing protein [Pseudomonas fluorescens group sp. PF-69]